MPLGYLLTFSTYGTHLHGDARGSFHAGAGYQPPDTVLRERNAHRRIQPAFALEEPARSVVLHAFVGLAADRSWELRAAHVRTEHVHVVVQCIVGPRRAIGDLKARATHALRTRGLAGARQRVWAEGGSARHLFDEDAVVRAAEYVYERQGTPMARFSRVGLITAGSEATG